MNSQVDNTLSSSESANGIENPRHNMIFPYSDIISYTNNIRSKSNVHDESISSDYIIVWLDPN